MNITVKGNVGQDPEFKVSKSGTQVCSFSLAYTPRKKQGTEWIDGETMWFRVVQFGEKAEIAADSLAKGDSVMVTGTLKQSTFTDKEGNQRTGLEIMADEVGIVPRPVRKTKTEDTPPW
jgi:single-strand DNA-binding protein